MFLNSTVTGAAVTSIIPIPTTCPVLPGESPMIKSPWEETNAKTVPMVEGEPCVATHQSNSYLPGSCKVMTPVVLS